MHVLLEKSYFYQFFPLQSLIPRVAAKLDVAAISDIIDVTGEDTFVRTIYAGNAIQTVSSKDSVKLVTVRGTAFPEADATGGSCTQEDGERVDMYMLRVTYMYKYSVFHIYIYLFIYDSRWRDGYGG